MQLTLAEKSYEYLRKKLTQSELAPGTRLVNRTLAREIGVSLAPVREAIDRLTAEGLIERIPGVGAFVREFTWQELEDIYIVREAVEGCAAAEAAYNISTRELGELDAICRHWRELVDAIRRQPSKAITSELAADWTDIDEQFHAVLVSASHNGLLQKIVRESRLLQRAFKSLYRTSEAITLHEAAWTWRDHASLVRALRRRDPQRARDLMVRQIRKGRRFTLKALKHVRYAVSTGIDEVKK